MAYSAPMWGVWSGEHDKMLAQGFTDLDEAKKRVWEFFDAGDESVMVVPVCPQHPHLQLTAYRLTGQQLCRKRADGGADHEVTY